MLLVFLAATPRADRADPWVRMNARGEVVARGEAPRAQWPNDDDVVVVLEASQVRLLALDMPPMSHDRLERAVRLAVDDVVASDADDTAIAFVEPGAGNVLVAVTSRALLSAIASVAPRAARIVPESALAPHADAWTWYRSAAGGGFVRRDDGSAFTVGETAGHALPPELVVALAQAVRASHAPRAISCAFASDATERSRWSQAIGASFLPAAAWRWDEAPLSAITRAPDFARNARQSRSNDSPHGWRAFRPALILAGLALALHLGSLAATRASLAIQNARLASALVGEAAALRLPDTATPGAAAAAIARRDAERRHAAGKGASSDALPLLARAAPALATLPPGTLRSARYGGDAWTLELGPLDRDALSRISRALAASGLDALAAPASGGTRMRVALAATAR
jgi:general secretion pathway protein L